MVQKFENAKNIRDRQHGSFEQDSVDEGINRRVQIKNSVSDPVPVTSDPSTTPTIYNVSAPTANTEVSQALNANVKQIMIRVRGNARAKIAFVATESATNYFSLPAGATLTLDKLSASVTLYMQTDKNTQVIEVLEWT